MIENELKFGRRVPSNKPSIKFKSILKAVPVHPVSDDYLSQLSGWNILGNNKYGNCAAVSWANSRKFVTDELLGKEDYPTLDQVLEIYKTQNPNFPTDDNGMDLQTLLKYLVDYGGADGVKAIAFASVNFHNLDEVKAAIYIFGSIILGINVQSQNMDDFNSGNVWQYRPTDSVDGGHAVLSGGYLGSSSDDIRFITWGQEAGLTDEFWKNLVEEAWVIVWPENLGQKQFVDGIDIQALADDYQSLTGNVLPVIIPPTPPVPQPVPIPNPNNPGCLDSLLSKTFKL